MHKRRQAKPLTWQSKDEELRRQLFPKVDFCLCFTCLWSAITPIAAAGKRGQAVPCSFSPLLLETNPKAVSAMGQAEFS